MCVCVCVHINLRCMCLGTYVDTLYIYILKLRRRISGYRKEKRLYQNPAQIFAPFEDKSMNETPSVYHLVMALVLLLREKAILPLEIEHEKAVQNFEKC